MDVGARVTNIVVHEGGSPRFIRILLMGGQDLTETVAERMGVSLPQAESPEAAARPARRRDDPAGRVLESGVAAFLDEVRGSFDYFQSTQAGTSYRSDPAHGGGSRLDRAGRAVEQTTRIPVETATPSGPCRSARPG